MSHVPYPICPHTYPTYPAYPHIPHTRTTTHAPPPPPTYKARSDLFFRPSVRPSRVFRCSALFRSHSPVLSLYRLVRTPQPTHITHTHPYTHHTHTPHIHHIYTCTAPPAPTLASDRDRRSFPVARSLVLCSLFSFLCSVSFVHLVSFRFVSFRFGSVRFFVLDAADFGFGYMVWARSFVRDVASSPRRLWTVSHFRSFRFVSVRFVFLCWMRRTLGLGIWFGPARSFVTSPRRLVDCGLFRIFAFSPFRSHATCHMPRAVQASPFATYLFLAFAFAFALPLVSSRLVSLWCLLKR
ncbi:hypothetical protein L226DRAFT_112768 [Lentinus tigrinus ALCF2SS1-7]|uniref:uncharacterized protein n=1 Tax=Lentinus tigrinus ALCF2SS1-7 TaxID=1328758 RepID=UPI0011661BBC|nr:hypothetical protein L226DRAFT_112768 [Lentinus tigrinus ALCF2SS1-7]